MQRALALSLLAHLALLLSYRGPAAPSDDPNTPLDLRLWVDTPGEFEHDVPDEAELRPGEIHNDSLAPVSTSAAAQPDDPSEPQEREPAPLSTEDQALPANPIETTSQELAASPDPAALQDLAATQSLADSADFGQPPNDLQAALASPGAASDLVLTDAGSMPQTEEKMLVEEVADWSRSFQKTRKATAPKSWRKNGRQYTARIERLLPANETSLERVNVVITTEKDGKALETRMQLKRLAFSNFTQLVDEWDPAVGIHDDTIVGRFHSNKEIMLDLERDIAPRILGVFTTAARGYKLGQNSPFKSRKELFPGGSDLRAPEITLPEQLARFDAIAAQTGGQVKKFETDTRIEFLADGSYRWRDLSKDSSAEGRETYADRPLYLLAARHVQLQLLGRVRGQVLVYSPREIMIVGHLRYANDVRSDQSAADYLGLVSDNVVSVAEPELTGPGDLTVDAAIFAKWAFMVRKFSARSTPRATLAVFGSVSAGTLSATEPRYATRIEYDPRFEKLRPPGFPVTNRYEKELWDQRWHAVPAR